MNKTAEKKRPPLSALYRLSPAGHIIAAVSAALILLHLLTRDNHALMVWASERLVRPVHCALAVLNDHLPFSVAELLIGLAVIAVLVYIIYTIIKLIRCGGRLKRLYAAVINLLAAGLAVYAGFCMLWGVYYYGDDFMTRSGLKNDNISVEQLETVTEYFAALVNEYSSQVPRDADGNYVADRDAILRRSNEVYANVEETLPCLSGPAVRAKGVYFSRVMSYTDFTGFFFPFTAEANVNTDFPPALFASTVAHELAHQRGVAKEQEANFAAVLASLEYGDAEYCYSACVLAYTHLGNALHSADYDAWKSIYLTLNEDVRRDFAANREYWAQFETPVQKVSNTVYEGFLYSYDQSMGLKSYGACVDLLVNYYYEQASVALEN